LVLFNGMKRLAGGSRLGSNLEVRFLVEKLGKANPHHWMIIHEEDSSFPRCT